MEFKIINDIVENIFSGGTPNTKKEEFWNGNIEWLSSGETRNRFITRTERKISKAGVVDSSTKLAKINDIVIASAGQGYTRGQTSFCLIDTYINQSIISIRANTEKVLPLYLFYNLSSRYNELRAISDSQSSRGSLTTKLIKDLPILLPSLNEQRKIANILYNLDQKIELNNKIIENLEQLAQTVFKRWFVDFEFLNENGEPYKSSGGEMVESELGMIPVDWGVLSLIDILDYQGGSQPSSKEFKGNHREGYVRLIQIRDFDTDSHLTYIPDTPKLKKCKSDDIMLARYGAALGRVLFGLEGAYNVALAKVIPKSINYQEYIRCFLNTRDFYERLNSMGERSAQSGFNRSDISSFKVIIPKSESLLKVFQNKVRIFITYILRLRKENIELSSLRDTLLPKLLSGEIELPDETEVTGDVPIP